MELGSGAYLKSPELPQPTQMVQTPFPAPAHEHHSTAPGALSSPVGSSCQNAAAQAPPEGKEREQERERDLIAVNSPRGRARTIYIGLTL